MKKLEPTKAWILLCSVIAAISATAEHSSGHNGVPHHEVGSIPPRHKTQSTPVPVGIQMPEDVMSRQEVSCISTDRNIFEIMKETKETCIGKDMLCTFYLFANHKYYNIGTLEINKELFDVLLMKYDNWLLTAEKIDEEDTVKHLPDHIKRDHEKSAASLNQNNFVQNNNLFTPSEFKNSHENDSLHIDKFDHNMYYYNAHNAQNNTDDSEHIENTQNDYDPSKIRRHEENSKRALNIEEKEGENGNYIKLDPKYNNKHKYFEVFLPKDKYDGHPRTINVEINNEKNNFLLFEEKLNKEPEKYKPLKIDLEELPSITDCNTSSENQGENRAFDPSSVNNHNDNLVDSEILHIDNKINSNIDNLTPLDAAQKIVNIALNDLGNLNHDDYLSNKTNVHKNDFRNTRTEETNTELPSIIIDMHQNEVNVSKNVVEPKKFTNHAELYIKSELDNNVDINLPKIHAPSDMTEENSKDSRNGGNINILNAKDDSLKSNYDFSVEEDDVDLNDDSNIQSVEHSNIYNDVDFDNAHDLSIHNNNKQRSMNIHLNEPVYQVKKPYQENLLESTPYIVSLPKSYSSYPHAGIGDDNNPQLNLISSQSEPLETIAGDLSSIPSIPLLNPQIESSSLLLKKLSKTIKPDFQLQPVSSSSLPAHSSPVLDTGFSQNSQLDTDFGQPPTESNINQYTFPILPIPPIESTMVLNIGSENSPINVGFSWLPAFSRIEELRLPCKARPISEDSKTLCQESSLTIPVSDYNEISVVQKSSSPAPIIPPADTSLFQSVPSSEVGIEESVFNNEPVLETTPQTSPEHSTSVVELNILPNSHFKFDRIPENKRRLSSIPLSPNEALNVPNPAQRIPQLPPLTKDTLLDSRLVENSQFDISSTKPLPQFVEPYIESIQPDLFIPPVPSTSLLGEIIPHRDKDLAQTSQPISKLSTEPIVPLTPNSRSYPLLLEPSLLQNAQKTVLSPLLTPSSDLLHPESPHDTHLLTMSNTSPLLDIDVTVTPTENILTLPKKPIKSPTQVNPQLSTKFSEPSILKLDNSLIGRNLLPSLSTTIYPILGEDIQSISKEPPDFDNLLAKPSYTTLQSDLGSQPLITGSSKPSLNLYTDHRPKPSLAIDSLKYTDKDEITEPSENILNLPSSLYIDQKLQKDILPSTLIPPTILSLHDIPKPVLDQPDSSSYMYSTLESKPSTLLPPSLPTLHGIPLQLQEQAVTTSLDVNRQLENKMLSSNLLPLHNMPLSLLDQTATSSYIDSKVETNTLPSTLLEPSLPPLHDMPLTFQDQPDTSSYIHSKVESNLLPSTLLLPSLPTLQTIPLQIQPAIDSSLRSKMLSSSLQPPSLPSLHTLLDQTAIESSYIHSKLENNNLPSALIPPTLPPLHDIPKPLLDQPDSSSYMYSTLESKPSTLLPPSLPTLHSIPLSTQDDPATISAYFHPTLKSNILTSTLLEPSLPTLHYMSPPEVQPATTSSYIDSNLQRDILPSTLIPPNLPSLHNMPLPLLDQPDSSSYIHSTLGSKPSTLLPPSLPTLHGIPLSSQDDPATISAYFHPTLKSNMFTSTLLEPSLPTLHYMPPPQVQPATTSSYIDSNLQRDILPSTLIPPNLPSLHNMPLPLLDQPDSSSYIHSTLESKPSTLLPPSLPTLHGIPLSSQDDPATISAYFHPTLKSNMLTSTLLEPSLPTLHYMPPPQVQPATTSSYIDSNLQRDILPSTLIPPNLPSLHNMPLPLLDQSDTSYIHSKVESNIRPLTLLPPSLPPLHDDPIPLEHEPAKSLYNYPKLECNNLPSTLVPPSLPNLQDTSMASSVNINLKPSIFQTPQLYKDIIKLTLDTKLQTDYSYPKVSVPRNILELKTESPQYVQQILKLPSSLTDTAQMIPLSTDSFTYLDTLPSTSNTISKNINFSKITNQGSVFPSLASEIVPISVLKSSPQDTGLTQITPALDSENNFVQLDISQYKKPVSALPSVTTCPETYVEDESSLLNLISEELTSELGLPEKVPPLLYTSAPPKPIFTQITQPKLSLTSEVPTEITNLLKPSLQALPSSLLPLTMSAMPSHPSRFLSDENQSSLQNIRNSQEILRLPSLKYIPYDLSRLNEIVYSNTRPINIPVSPMSKLLPITSVNARPVSKKLISLPPTNCNLLPLCSIGPENMNQQTSLRNILPSDLALLLSSLGYTILPPKVNFPLFSGSRCHLEGDMGDYHNVASGAIPFPTFSLSPLVHSIPHPVVLPFTLLPKQRLPILQSLTSTIARPQFYPQTEYPYDVFQASGNSKPILNSPGLQPICTNTLKLYNPVSLPDTITPLDVLPQNLAVTPLPTLDHISEFVTAEPTINGLPSIELSSLPIPGVQVKSLPYGTPLHVNFDPLKNDLPSLAGPSSLVDSFQSLDFNIIPSHHTNTDYASAQPTINGQPYIELSSFPTSGVQVQSPPCGIPIDVDFHTLQNDLQPSTGPSPLVHSFQSLDSYIPSHPTNTYINEDFSSTPSSLKSPNAPLSPFVTIKPQLNPYKQVPQPSPIACIQSILEASTGNITPELLENSQEVIGSTLLSHNLRAMLGLTSQGGPCPQLPDFHTPEDTITSSSSVYSTPSNIESVDEHISPLLKASHTTPLIDLESVCHSEFKPINDIKSFLDEDSFQLHTGLSILPLTKLSTLPKIPVHLSPILNKDDNVLFAEPVLQLNMPSTSTTPLLEEDIIQPNLVCASALQDLEVSEVIKPTSLIPLKPSFSQISPPSSILSPLIKPILPMPSLHDIPPDILKSSGPVDFTQSFEDSTTVLANPEISLQPDTYNSKISSSNTNINDLIDSDFTQKTPLKLQDSLLPNLSSEMSLLLDTESSQNIPNMLLPSEIPDILEHSIVPCHPHFSSSLSSINPILNTDFIQPQSQYKILQSPTYYSPLLDTDSLPIPSMVSPSLDLNKLEHLLESSPVYSRPLLDLENNSPLESQRHEIPNIPKSVTIPKFDTELLHLSSIPYLESWDPAFLSILNLDANSQLHSTFNESQHSTSRLALSPASIIPLPTEYIPTMLPLYTSQTIPAYSSSLSPKNSNQLLPVHPQSDSPLSSDSITQMLPLYTRQPFSAYPAVFQPASVSRDYASSKVSLLSGQLSLVDNIPSPSMTKISQALDISKLLTYSPATPMTYPNLITNLGLAAYINPLSKTTTSPLATGYANYLSPSPSQRNMNDLIESILVDDNNVIQSQVQSPQVVPVLSSYTSRDDESTDIKYKDENLSEEPFVEIPIEYSDFEEVTKHLIAKDFSQKGDLKPSLATPCLDTTTVLETKLYGRPHLISSSQLLVDTPSFQPCTAPQVMPLQLDTISSAPVNNLDNYNSPPLTNTKLTSNPPSFQGSLVRPSLVKSFNQNVAPSQITSHATYTTPLQEPSFSKFSSQYVSPLPPALMLTNIVNLPSLPINEASIYSQGHVIPTNGSSGLAIKSNIIKNPSANSETLYSNTLSNITPLSFKYNLPNVDTSKMTPLVTHKLSAYKALPSSSLQIPFSLHNIQSNNLPSVSYSNPIKTVPFYMPSRPLKPSNSPHRSLKTNTQFSNDNSVPLPSPVYTEPLKTAVFYQSPNIEHNVPSHQKLSTASAKCTSPSYTTLSLDTNLSNLSPYTLSNPYLKSSMLQNRQSIVPVYSAPILPSSSLIKPLINADFNTKVSYPYSKDIVSQTKLKPLDTVLKSPLAYSQDNLSPESEITRVPLYSSSIVKRLTDAVPPQKLSYLQPPIESQYVSQLPVTDFDSLSPAVNIAQLLPSTRPLLQSPLLRPSFTSIENTIPLQLSHMSRIDTLFPEIVPSKQFPFIPRIKQYLTPYLQADSDSLVTELPNILQPSKSSSTSPYSFPPSPYTYQYQSPVSSLLYDSQNLPVSLQLFTLLNSQIGASPASPTFASSSLTSAGLDLSQSPILQYLSTPSFPQYGKPPTVFRQPNPFITATPFSNGQLPTSNDQSYGYLQPKSVAVLPDTLNIPPSQMPSYSHYNILEPSPSSLSKPNLIKLARPIEASPITTLDSSSMPVDSSVLPYDYPQLPTYTSPREKDYSLNSVAEQKSPSYLQISQYSIQTPQPSPIYTNPQLNTDFVQDQSNSEALSSPNVLQLIPSSTNSESQQLTRFLTGRPSPKLPNSPHKPLLSPLSTSPLLTNPQNWFKSPIETKCSPIYENPVEIIPHQDNVIPSNILRPSTLPNEHKSSITDVPIKLDESLYFNEDYFTPYLLEAESIAESQPNIINSKSIENQPESFEFIDNDHVESNEVDVNNEKYLNEISANTFISYYDKITPKIQKPTSTYGSSQLTRYPQCKANLQSPESLFMLDNFYANNQIGKNPPEVTKIPDLPTSYTSDNNINNIKYSGYKTYQIPALKSPQIHQISNPSQMYSPSEISQSFSTIPKYWKPISITPVKLTVPFESKLDLNNIQQSSNVNGYDAIEDTAGYVDNIQTKLSLKNTQQTSILKCNNPIEKIPVCEDKININNDLKSSIFNYINNKEEVKDGLYNNYNDELIIPLGDIAIIKREPCVDDTIETNNPSIGLKVWKSNAKIVKAEIKLKFKELSVNNFMPIVNNLDHYDVGEIRRIVKSYIDEKYGHHIEVNEPYTIDNQYTVIKDFDYDAVDNKFNILWPTNYV